MSLRRKFPSVPVGLLEVSSCEHQWLLPGNLIDVHLEHLESRKRKAQSLCLWGSWTLIPSLTSPFHVCLFHGSLQEKRFQSKTASSQVVCGYKLPSSKSSHLNFSIFRGVTTIGVYDYALFGFLPRFCWLSSPGVFSPEPQPVQASGQLFRAPSKSPDLMPREVRTCDIIGIFLRFHWDRWDITGMGGKNQKWHPAQNIPIIFLSDIPWSPSIFQEERRWTMLHCTGLIEIGLETSGLPADVLQVMGRAARKQFRLMLIWGHHTIYVPNCIHNNFFAHVKFCSVCCLRLHTALYQVYNLWSCYVAELCQ